MTSRWVVETAPHKGVPVRWRAYSVDIKNENVEIPEDHRFLERAGRVALRVVEAVWAEHGDEPIGRLYTEIGNRFHLQHDVTLEAVDAAVQATGLGSTFIAAADDETWDAEIRGSMAEAIDEVGDDVGVPILVFSDGSRKAGISGPIMSPSVTGEPALALWDNVVGLAWNPNVFELKRTRTGPPQLQVR